MPDQVNFMSVRMYAGIDVSSITNTKYNRHISFYQ